MPDTAVAEPTLEAIAEPAVEDSPTPAPVEQTAPEGDAAPPAEGDAGTGTDFSPVEAELEAEAERRADAKAAAKIAEAEKQRAVRTGEADKGQAARQELYTTSKREAGQSARALLQAVENGDTLDPDDLNTHMNKVMAGTVARVSEENETAIQKAIDAVLPDLTEAEGEALEPLLYDFRRNGRIEEIPQKIAELSSARKDAEIADLKKQLKDRGVVTAMAEKLANASNAAGPGVGAETPRGKSASGITYDQLQKMKPAEIEKMSPEEVDAITSRAMKG